MTCSGVPAGANIACQYTTSSFDPNRSGKLSAVGNSGSFSPEVTPNAFNAPVATCCTMDCGVAKNKSTCPPNKSVIAGAAATIGNFIKRYAGFLCKQARGEVPGRAIAGNCRFEPLLLH